MSRMEVIALMPLLILFVTALALLLQISIRRHHLISFLISMFGFVLAFLSLTGAMIVAPQHITTLIIIDRFAIFFMTIILLASAIAAVLSYNYLARQSENKDEYYLVLLLATLGSMVLVASSHFVSLFLGLEILTVSLYILIAYLRGLERSLEAGIKYLILAGASSSFLLFGMSMIYARLGTMEFSLIARAVGSDLGTRDIFILTGTALFLTGLAFKLAVVPFHMWTPDVYEGAPAPVSAFIATVSKGAIFALLLRYFIEANAYSYRSALIAISLISVFSMFIGNFLALLQSNVKRILAYSSISHLGYMLVAFVAAGDMAVEAVLFYFAAYFLTTLAAFGVISLLSDERGERMALEDYRGLFWSRPLPALVFTLALLSLAGIPLTAGFVGKFMVLLAGIDSALWGLVVLLVINSAIGLYYYLRVVAVMYSRPTEAIKPVMPRLDALGRIILVMLGTAIFYFGIYPAPLVEAIRRMIVR